MTPDPKVYEEFIWFIKERESIRKKKEAGEPKPWTKDPILQKYKFCCIFRQDDKTTKALQARIKGMSKENAILNIFLLRLINNVSEINRIPLVEFGKAEDWTTDSIKWGDAFIVLPAMPKGSTKIGEVKRLLVGVETSILARETVLGCFERMRIKGLILYEMMCDWWSFAGLPETYCNIGGGAKPTLKRMFPGERPSVEQIEWIVDDLNKRGISHEKYGKVTMRVVEGCLCEVRKIHALRQGTGRRRYYRPSV